MRYVSEVWIYSKITIEIGLFYQNENKRVISNTEKILYRLKTIYFANEPNIKKDWLLTGLF